MPNRGKRSIGIDLRSDEGLAVLYKLAETADVFLTSFLPDARQKLKIDVEHIRALNPDIVYVRGSGQGQRGPESERGRLRLDRLLVAQRRSRRRPDPVVQRVPDPGRRRLRRPPRAA